MKKIVAFITGIVVSFVVTFAICHSVNEAHIGVANYKSYHATYDHASEYYGDNIKLKPCITVNGLVEAYDVYSDNNELLGFSWAY